jgi:hypothetical protein
MLKDHGLYDAEVHANCAGCRSGNSQEVKGVDEGTRGYERVLQTVVLDNWGPITPTSWAGNRYLTVTKDMCSKYKTGEAYSVGSSFPERIKRRISKWEHFHNTSPDTLLIGNVRRPYPLKVAKKDPSG